ncbi:prolyl oligopeptidase family serine peptidase [Halobacillus sp. HZG1]|uniref:alpha/beta hydrolase family protein n=1 Tax=Halobacillus sp. HZG1 TaxID=3111769 RepID=UPI002DB63F78|nr:prolyl oligopeptidase family serine peptidase [Halobacillus sp. HZG1]MEC3882313.1 prolyl oligopeptidase family serine peptidase [Halobacillus sp. HZG1]
MKKLLGAFLVFLSFMGAVVFFVGDSEDSVLQSKKEVEIGVPGVTGYSITYKSGDTDIPGLWIEPENIEESLPLLIHNRGGVGESSLTDAQELKNLSYWAEQGYVVLATHYRENAEENVKVNKKEDFVQDVLDLKKVGAELDHVDEDRTVMLGYSRGGWMSLLAVQQEMDVDAVAVIGAITDLEHLYTSQPASVQKQIEQLMGPPGGEHSWYRELSPIQWVEEVGVPTLVLHGGRDRTVPVEKARYFVSLMEREHNIHRYIEYENGDHGLRLHFKAYAPEVLEWFEKHLEGG